jgi:hypothetical protein
MNFGGQQSAHSDSESSVTSFRACSVWGTTGHPERKSRAEAAVDSDDRQNRSSCYLAWVRNVWRIAGADVHVECGAGGVFAMVLDKVFPSAHLSAGAFALVAMGAVFGAASRATFSFIIFAFEITRDYNAVLPLMLVSVIADGISMLMMPQASILTEKLARRGLKIHSGIRS